MEFKNNQKIKVSDINLSEISLDEKSIKIIKEFISIYSKTKDKTILRDLMLDILNNMNTKKSQAKTVRLNEQVIRNVEKRARIENRNFSNMVETILFKVT